MFGIKMAMDVKILVAVVGDSHVTLIKPAVVTKIW